MAQWVYSFGTNGTDGDSSMRNLLGGKGANLAEMSGIGLPVPPGFTITTEVCTYFYDNDHSYPDSLKKDVAAAIALIEAETGTLFADAENPLLVSVRSGARASMPGMMDTVLNLGLNDDTAAGLAARALVRCVISQCVWKSWLAILPPSSAVVIRPRQSVPACWRKLIW